MSAPYPKLDMSEDMSTQDAHNYLQDCIVHEYNGTRVIPYRLHVPTRSYYEDEDGYEHEDEDSGYEEVFADSTCTLLSMEDSTVKTVRGGALLSYPEYIVHRPPVEYVPIEDGRYLARVTLEPEGRRMYKGLSAGSLRPLPLLEAGVPVGLMRGETGLASVQGGWATREGLAIGIASVLSLGTPDCMRRVISARDASLFAKLAVQDMFLSDHRRCCVPDFSVAIVRHRTRRNEAYVLRRGFPIGKLMYDNGELIFYGDSKYTDRGVRRKVAAGQDKLAMRLFATEVRWS